MADTPQPSIGQNGSEKPKKTRFRRVLRRVENFIFYTVIFFVGLYFLLQAPFVQNWLIGKLTNWLSKELQTTVSVQHIDIELFDKVALDGFYVADQQGDTLLYAGQLRVGLNSNFFAFLGDRVVIDDVLLKKARFNIIRREGQYDNNLKFILDAPLFKGSGKKKQKSSGAIAFEIHNVRLEDVAVLKENQVRGERIYLELPEGNVKVKNLDLDANIIDIASVDLHGLFLNFSEQASKPMPPRPVSTALKSPRDSTKVPDTLQFRIAQFNLDGGRFLMDRFQESPAKTTVPEVMDYDHMKVEDIAFRAENVQFTDELYFSGRLLELSAREQCGFALQSCYADKVEVDCSQTALYGAKVRTAGSELGDTILLHYDNYKAFNRFNSLVELDIHLGEGSRLRLGDVMHFQEVVNDLDFFKNNRDMIADVSGWVHGTVRGKLKGDNLKIGLEDGTEMEGSFRGDSLSASTDKQKIEIGFERLQTNINTIARIIPGFKAPKYFYTLGNLTFSKGNYQLLFGVDHILYGDIKTDIGFGHVDMSMNLKDGRDKAQYGGYLQMSNFDLAKWTGDDNFGKTAFNFSIADGSSGLSVSTIDAGIKGVVDSLSYKGYLYRKIAADGAFKSKVFDGKLRMKDNNIHFDFDGKIDLNPSIPRLIFNADVYRLDLGALNLTDKDIVVSARVEKMDLNAKDFNDITGQILLKDINILQDKEVMHRVSELEFVSKYRGDGTRYLNFYSDFATVNLEGEFNLLRTAKTMEQLFARYHPAISARFGLQPNDSLELKDHYELRAQIKDTRQLTHLIDYQLDTLKDIYIKARIEGESGLMQFFVEAPKIRYQGFEFDNSSFSFYSLRDSASYNLRIPNTHLPNGKKLDLLRVGGLLAHDELSFSVEANDNKYIVEDMNLNGVLSTYDSLWQVQFNASRIALFNLEWLMPETNYIRFDDKHIETQEFELFAEDKRITLSSTEDGRGLTLLLSNLNLNALNRFMPDTSIRFEAKLYDLDVQIKDVFRMEGMAANINSDSLFINEVYYGDLFANVDMAALDQPLGGKIFLLDGSNRQIMRLGGAYLIDSDSARYYEDQKIWVKPGEINARVETDAFPLSILETFVPGISNTNGAFNAGVNLSGPFNALKTEGPVKVTRGQFKLDYLNSTFNLQDQTLNLSEYKIWASDNGDTLWDSRSPNNKAVMTGGLKHDHFSKWQLDCTIRSLGDNFMMLNTTAKDNDLYYGQGIGRFTAKFSGTFSRTNIVIDATTGKDTRLYIPLSTASDVSSENFIQFTKKDTAQTNTDKEKSLNNEPTGLNIEMNLSVTDQAEIQMIFDEQAGDIIKGRGTGDIKMVLNRQNEFLMYGSYRIRRGEYLFTLLNFVNKPFTVAEGGTINWFGDPYGADINLDATYRETTPLTNLIRDEAALLGGALAAEASNATEVVVTMHMKGELFKPIITFDLDFPEISSTLKSVTDNKLRQMRQDQNELTKQVFGLVVMGTFLPSNSSQFIQSSDYVASALHTVTQVLSNQLSNYLTELATVWFGGKVSSIDFDIAYNDYRSSLSGATTAQIDRDLQLRLTSGLFNDRVTVQFGSQFGFGSNTPGQATQNGFLGEDVTVEIQLTKNRHWRVKMYQRTEPDFGGGLRRSRYGFGLSFRREYATIQEMVNGVGEALGKKKPKPKPENTQ